MNRDVRILLFHGCRILHRIGRAVRRINKVALNCRILRILFRSIALSLALTAATASAIHFGIKVII